MPAYPRFSSYASFLISLTCVSFVAAWGNEIASGSSVHPEELVIDMVMAGFLSFMFGIFSAIFAITAILAKHTERVRKMIEGIQKTSLETLPRRPVAFHEVPLRKE